MNSLNFEKQNIIPEGAYQEAFTAPLEKMIESKLSKLLDAIHKVYVQQIMSGQSKFNDIVNSVGSSRISKIKNFHDFKAQGDPLVRLLSQGYRMAYNLGAKQTNKEMVLKTKPFIPNEKNILESEVDGVNTARMIIKSYQDLTYYAMLSALKKGEGFNYFVNETINHPSFKKSAQGKDFSSNKIYLPAIPNARVIKENVLAHVIKSFNKAKVDIFNKLGIGEKVIYKTRNDEKVSTICREDHDKPMTLDYAQQKIPQHVNCRCTFVPT